MTVRKMIYLAGMGLNPFLLFCLRKFFGRVYVFGDLDEAREMTRNVAKVVSLDETITSSTDECLKFFFYAKIYINLL